MLLEVKELALERYPCGAMQTAKRRGLAQR
jgi:hypothetical protein